MWTLPKPPANENARLDALAACGVMDTAGDERFDRLTRLASRFYAADAAFIGFVDENFQWMKALTSEELPRSVARKDTVCNLIIESGEPMTVGDLQTDPRLRGHPLVPLLTLRFYAGVPLVIRPDLVIGTFCIMRREAGDEAEFDIEPLKELAAIAMDEVELWTLNRELERLTQIDALTGIANRRGFDDALERSVRRARRTGLPLSLLLVDLDHFKKVNDLLGHQAGDEVLRRIGALLTDVVARPFDSVGRYGGEEFAVILPDTDIAGARHIAGLIRERLAAAGIPHPAGGAVTASIGVACQPGYEADAAQLIAESDTALYQAKRGGRDRVSCHRKPVRQRV